MEKLPSSIEISKQLYLQIVNGEEVLEFQKYLNGDKLRYYWSDETV